MSTNTTSNTPAEAANPPSAHPILITPPNSNFKPDNKDTPRAIKKVSTEAAHRVVEQPLSQTRKLQASEMEKRMAYLSPDDFLELMVNEASQHGPPLQPISDEELKAAVSTPWRMRVREDLVVKYERRIFKHLKSWERK